MLYSKTVYASICVNAMMFAMAQAQAAPSQTLLNHVPRAVGESRQLGAVSLHASLTLSVGLPLRNSQDLDLFLAQVSDPQSPNYRSYLSASDFAERFGPTEADYDKLIAFVQSKGFTVSGTHANRTILDITGTVSAINEMLHVTMTAWEHPKRGRFFSPDRDPSLDADLQVLDIDGLDNFIQPTPMDLKVMPLTSAIPFVSGSGPSGLFLGKDFRAAYAPGVTLTGAGQTIGLVEFDGFYAADVTANFKQAGLPAIPVQTVLLDGFNGVPGSGNIEVILDIVMAGYMAPGASVIVYEGQSPNDVLNRMATDNLAKQLSCSWGFGINSTTEQIFKQMIAQGQTFVTASGDSGAYTGPIMPPADDPNVTSVGGTALTTTGPGGTWLSESAWTGSGGGVSESYAIPSYQQGMNMAAQGGSNTMRNIPDVALTGAVQMFLIYSNGAQTAVGGTSAATPLWGAFIALTNQQAAASSKPSVGFLNPALYALGNGSSYGIAMHDVSMGSNGFAAIQGFDLATGWGTPNGQALINDLSATPVTTPPSTPSFTLADAPGSISLKDGSNGTSVIQVTAQNGFTAAVTLSVTGLPTGVTGTFGAFNASRASTLTLTTSSTVAAGTYPLSIKGVSGSLTASAALSLVVTGVASYTLTTSAASLNVVAGGTGITAISVAAANGFNSTVALTVSGLPTGVTASFSPASTATSSTLTLTAGATAVASTSTVTVTGKSGSLSASTSIVLTVASPGSFTMAASAPSLSVVRGAGAPGTITITPKNGFAGNVTLTASGLPAGVTASFSPAYTSTSSVVTFSAASSAPAGVNTVTVTGTSGATSSSVTISVTVKLAASFGFGASPAALTIAQGGSGTSTVTVTPLNGFTGTAALAVSGLPNGVTATFSPVSTSSTSTLKLTAGTTALLGPAIVTVMATSGSVSAQAAIALTVVAPSGFKLSATTGTISAAPGGTGTATVAIVPQGGFTGAVQLTAAGLPAGVTASFSPASTSSTSILTLKVATGTVAKSSQFTINGTSGSLTAPLPIMVTVLPAQDFAINLAPASLRVLQGGKGDVAVFLSPLNGFAGNYTLSASGLPAGVTASFSQSNSGLFQGLFTVSAAAAPGTSSVSVIAASGSLSHAATLALTVLAPTAATTTVDLSPYYNVSGYAVDSLTFTNGGLDGVGHSYSGVLLGASQSVSGNVYSLGPMGSPDAVSGQTVTLPAGQFATLKMLATGVNGNQPSQIFVVTYTDGTTTSFTQGMSDWYTPQSYPGESRAVSTNYRDDSIGTTEQAVFYVYGYSLTLNSAKPVKSITLPKNRNVVVLSITLAGSVNAASKANTRPVKGV